MNSLQEIKSTLSKHKEHLYTDYPIKSMAIFGSYSRNEQNKKSDLDIIVEFNGKIGIRFIDLADELEDLIASPSLPTSAGDFHMSLAPLYAFTGDKEKAYRVLDELIRQHNTYPSEWIVSMKHNPMLDNLREEERFRRILQIMEDRHQAEHKRVEKWLKKTGRL